MSRARRTTSRGLTLFEVIISIALIGMLLGALVTFFSQTLTARDYAAHAVARTQIVQQVLTRIANELRATVATDQTGFLQMTQFVGERRRITFLTTPLPSSDSYAFFREAAGALAPRHDLVEVTYELWTDPKEETPEGNPVVGGILRTERHALNPSVQEEEIATEDDVLYRRHDLWSYELGYLEFRYFDGAEWSTSWQVDEGNALPHLVQVTIGFDSITRNELDDEDLQQYPIDRYPLGPDVPYPNRYSMIVQLPAADQLFSARLHKLSSEAEEVYTFPSGTQGTDSGGGTKP